jgi:very-short-patch-repair endonuclease
MHFRRQAPVGIYIADFVWHDGRLIIELDGSQHMQARRAYDEHRTEWLQSQGYKVLRFWNNEVLQTLRSVGEAILLAANNNHSDLKNPTPDPSPQGGGEHTGARGEDLRS